MTNEAGEGNGDDHGGSAATGEVRISERTGKPVRGFNTWTEKRQKLFLEQLARTCNITGTLAMLGMSRAGFYHLRKRDAGFREALGDALAMGYQQVEANLLAHALACNGEEDDGAGGAVAPRAFDPDLALRVLQFRDKQGRDQRKGGGPPVKRATEREIEDALVDKLKGLAKRLALEP